MTMGFGVLGFSPSFFGGSSRSVTTIASRFESGDQEPSVTLPCKFVSCEASPPARFSSHTWPPSSRLPRDETNASHFLSGLHRGCDSFSLLVVSRTCVEPSHLTIQMSLSGLSAALSMLVSVYATHSPSG